VERFLAKLERKYGKYAIEHLTYVIVGGMVLVFMLTMVRPDFALKLVLDLDRVKQGEVWRLFTYLFLPTSSSIFWILFAIWWVWIIGTNLESEWGALKFNLFYLLGMIGTTVAAGLTGAAQGNTWLNQSLFLAFATIFPNYEIYPIPFIPFSIRVKWLALINVVFLVYSILVNDWTVRAAIIAAMGNYLLFFSGTLWGLLRARNLQVRQAARRASFSPAADKATGGRVCAICGKREEDGADIRVCSCEKCGGPRKLCLEHARNH
jgi:membrane associated rhomboid family serine protease